MASSAAYGAYGAAATQAQGYGSGYGAATQQQGYGGYGAAAAPAASGGYGAPAAVAGRAYTSPSPAAGYSTAQSGYGAAAGAAAGGYGQPQQQQPQTSFVPSTPTVPAGGAAGYGAPSSYASSTGYGQSAGYGSYGQQQQPQSSQQVYQPKRAASSTQVGRRLPISAGCTSLSICTGAHAVKRDIGFLIVNDGGRTRSALSPTQCVDESSTQSELPPSAALAPPELTFVLHPIVSNSYCRC
jgi:hypothetical protein